MTTTRPTKSVAMPTASDTATISPQRATGTGLAKVALIEVAIATLGLVCRSSMRGKDTTEMQSTSMANNRPMTLPATIRIQPLAVVNIS